MKGGEIKDPRWLTVGDEPEDTLSEEKRLTLLEMHESAVEAFERLHDVTLQANHLNDGDIEKAASRVAAEAERVVVQIEEAAEYWEVNL